jgi:hypothetical protein
LKKGVIAIVAVAMVVILAVETIFLVNYVYRLEAVVRAAKETEIIAAANAMEFAKRVLAQALDYSFYQASHDVASRGGYSSLTDIQSYNCVPYWISYTSKNFPDYLSSLENSTLKIINAYGSKLKNAGVYIPQFTESEIEENNGEIKVSIHSNNFLKIENPNFYTITDQADFTTNMSSKILRLFEIGEEIADKVYNEIESSNSFADISNKISSIQSGLNNDYSSDNVQIDLILSQNLGSSDSNFAVGILVGITDKSNSYPTYDLTEESLASRNMQLKFYVFSGKEIVQAPTNECEEIVY